MKIKNFFVLVLVLITFAVTFRPATVWKAAYYADKTMSFLSGKVVWYNQANKDKDEEANKNDKETILLLSGNILSRFNHVAEYDCITKQMWVKDGCNVSSNASMDNVIEYLFDMEVRNDDRPTVTQ